MRAWWARRLKRQVPAVEYYSVSPAGHVVHDEAPETINQLLTQWIACKVCLHQFLGAKVEASTSLSKQSKKKKEFILHADRQT